ncbi:MAG: hypothetical protein A2268_03415 [Candidatus Raymondbacteria bacterium RifOxyA12_full_50_37]|uniref:Uncharacterized protein n=1 Tax=Candidatus Raymondbacteria bacterium RIFOXYD12_FULL_49_13 TaxID=1817890 RepID=A0A1F7F3I2_UNCRA|nr:MAG: hypothetical protein A2268_03415 [Candidatus Raymondbacteria bacterium RifOxyA12_full_50_37]OGJ88400.1 MAG: hypothetical protein A2248_00995 [Candidatus Raymondbacteria bacterium RIFOXYA2_FULL_49_16]OGJ96238.1 MAG: hypothetical protein A2453_08725 [Candidatus Raymondbacteria bacterium RIFOXYC2_FULL_50_21]OGK00571.1 MAG: hypothetical protein A2350_21630 [Candidatus Raymondbacteria bacterium RifOxyB12_full_50_8]OGK01230.1 MAG: hypothetical protein A2519_22540 [Candidatus Raymondbacteria b
MQSGRINNGVKIMKDPIVEEVRKAREEHALRFNNDLSKICADLKEQERVSGKKIVHLPAKRFQTTGS